MVTKELKSNASTSEDITAEIPFKVESDENGNVVLLNDDDEGQGINVTLFGFKPNILRYYSEFTVNKELYNFKVYSKMISEKLKEQEGKHEKKK